MGKSGRILSILLLPLFFRPLCELLLYHTSNLFTGRRFMFKASNKELLRKYFVKRHIHFCHILSFSGRAIT